ncbi:pirin family protein [Halocynthiibacter styelae]|uniref:Pirin family protein n=1 Tax=Halocynthiibacter styelae TaxID=2761955 RepID=A0A8J7ID39_9RHOB|nr:pirin family protein [Paenihalocynthiibacter styelae]MBI1493529.1 pirin family protein [Paenihalocynthiibacter styelae]
MSIRPALTTSLATPTVEGAGVHLHRAFGFHNPKKFDPFLLFDDFRQDDVKGDIAGFPWHPHRGIETISYVLNGTVEHADSLGNKGVIGAGDIQWMTAGSGIMHHEMPIANTQGQMHGFQLWSNLPASEKMCAPRYQDIPSGKIAERVDDDGTRIRVIAGDWRGIEGPVKGIATDPVYLDISVAPNTIKTLPMDTYRNTFAYVFAGSGRFADSAAPRGVLLEKEVMGQEVNIRDMSGNRTLVEFGTGNEIRLESGLEGVRFLLIAGAPLQEPIAWHGPIVMNTAEELRQAMSDLRNDRFIKPAH